MRASDPPDGGGTTDLFSPVPLRRLWKLLNTPRPIDPSSVRAACLILFTFYVVSCSIRHDAAHPELWWIRAAMAAYALLGVAFGPRFGWRLLRAYTFGMALALPASTLSVVLLSGTAGADMGLVALAIFVPIAFLQTGTDIVAAMAILMLGGSVVLHAVPNTAPALAGIVLAGAMAAGATTAFVLIAFRARVSDSMAWWQQACARERALREFTELAAPHLGADAQAAAFATTFAEAFGAGGCAIILAGDDDDPAVRLVATAGLPPPERGAGAVELSAVLAAVADRQAFVRERLQEAERRRFAAALPWVRTRGALVLLPIAVEDGVAGAVALSADAARRIAPEEVLVWRAMATQVGAAVGSARLFTRLQKALNVRNEFVNTMSHELRSPLNVILGYAEMLAEGHHDPTFIAARVRASALELLQLVENTMAVARLGTGKVAVQPSEFSLRELVDELTESTRALPEAHGGVPVRWEVAHDLPRVRLDRLKLKEIVHNLVSNGLKFTESGAVTVRMSREGERLRIEVEDTGPGIPRDAQARIFEMFERLERGPGQRAAGVGLGLSIVKSLVDLMGGTVAVDSECGHGARFVVRLPLWIPDDAPVRASA